MSPPTGFAAHPNSRLGHRVSVLRHIKIARRAQRPGAHYPRSASRGATECASLLHVAKQSFESVEAGTV
jgi:hypothetical protein